METGISKIVVGMNDFFLCFCDYERKSMARYMESNNVRNAKRDAGDKAREQD